MGGTGKYALSKLERLDLLIIVIPFTHRQRGVLSLGLEVKGACDGLALPLPSSSLMDSCPSPHRFNFKFNISNIILGHVLLEGVESD